ncbi:heavy-metal-associated domain-containing protein [Sanguibacter hominis ATCC BAA-789]|uniref:Heavy-metal-associated domain-containing protein n=1 Tax=Sanguibacter hominis ATCC BAA-789 TaxID=1312740 RepID=A0A9X5FAF4_9MICO|nr:heavy-metal-associated domain-containing protein [Sanguibacter hominis]NKX92730.1 heavy-metal-associated domain-containing protein [Sanguibacter hominis ATCC BAA-789]
MSTITTLDVTGMTCGHCVSAVTRELEAVPSVKNVSVDLNVGEASTVTVVSDAPLPEDALREAIDEAGYELAGIATHSPEQEFSHLADTRERVYAGTGMIGSGSAVAVGPVGISLTSREDADAAVLADAEAPQAGGCGCGGCGCGS